MKQTSKDEELAYLRQYWYLDNNLVKTADEILRKYGNASSDQRPERFAVVERIFINDVPGIDDFCENLEKKIRQFYKFRNDWITNIDVVELESVIADYLNKKIKFYELSDDGFFDPGKGVFFDWELILEEEKTKSEEKIVEDLAEKIQK